MRLINIITALWKNSYTLRAKLFWSLHLGRKGLRTVEAGVENIQQKP